MLRQYPKNHRLEERRKPSPSRGIYEPVPNGPVTYHASSQWRSARHSSRAAGPYFQGHDALDGIESLLVSSGIAPAEVLQYSSLLADSYQPRDDRAPRGPSPQFHDPGAELHQQQLQRNQYVCRLEQELEELTDRQANTCELLCAVTLRKDLNALVARELEDRQAIRADAEEGLSAVQSFFHARQMMLREALWRSRLERESVRAAVAEEKLSLRTMEVAAERTRADRAAEQAALSASSSRLTAAGISDAHLEAVVRTLLTESNEKLAALVDSVPSLVQAALKDSAGGESLRVFATAVQERVERGIAATAAPAPLLVTSPPSSPVVSSPTVARLSLQHQSLLFDKVVHVLEGVEDLFSRACHDKAAFVAAALVSESNAQKRELESSWRVELQAKRAEVKELREQILSLRAQKHQLMLSFHLPDGSHSSLPRQLNRQRHGSAASAMATGTAMTDNPAYELYCKPYIPPALKATKGAKRYSAKQLREDALRAGARPATDLMLPPVTVTEVKTAVPDNNDAERHYHPLAETTTRTSALSKGELPLGRATSVKSPVVPALGATTYNALSLSHSAVNTSLHVKTFTARSVSSSSSASAHSPKLVTTGSPGPTAMRTFKAAAEEGSSSDSSLVRASSPEPTPVKVAVRKAIAVAVKEAPPLSVKPVHAFDDSSSDDPSPGKSPPPLSPPAKREPTPAAQSKRPSTASETGVASPALTGLRALVAKLPSASPLNSTVTAASVRAASTSVASTHPMPRKDTATPRVTTSTPAALDSDSSDSLTLTLSSGDGAGATPKKKRERDKEKKVETAPMPVVKRSAFDEDSPMKVSVAKAVVSRTTGTTKPTLTPVTATSAMSAPAVKKRINIPW